MIYMGWNFRVKKTELSGVWKILGGFWLILCTGLDLLGGGYSQEESETLEE